MHPGPRIVHANKVQIHPAASYETVKWQKDAKENSQSTLSDLQLISCQPNMCRKCIAVSCWLKIIAHLVFENGNQACSFVFRERKCDPVTCILMAGVSRTLGAYYILLHLKDCEHRKCKSVQVGLFWVPFGFQGYYTENTLVERQLKLTQATVTWFITQKSLLAPVSWVGLNCCDHVNTSQSSQSLIEAVTEIRKDQRGSVACGGRDLHQHSNLTLQAPGELNPGHLRRGRVSLVSPLPHNPPSVCRNIQAASAHPVGMLVI